MIDLICGGNCCDDCDYLVNRVSSLAGFELTEYGKNRIKKAIYDFGESIISESIVASHRQYLCKGPEVFVDYIPRIAYNKFHQAKGVLDRNKPIIEEDYGNLEDYLSDIAPEVQISNRILTPEEEELEKLLSEV